MKFLSFLLIVSVTLTLSLRSSTVQSVQARKSKSLNYEYLFAFGDSMTDNGFSADQPSHGFGLYCNGPLWADYLAQELNIKHYENRGYVGATSGYENSSGCKWSGIMWQVDDLIRTYHVIPQGSLIAMQLCGGNDYFDNVNRTVETAQNSLKMIERLAEHGATDILALPAISIQACPGITQDYSYALNMSMLVADINKRITELLFDPENGVPQRYPKLNLRLFDFMGVVNELVLTFRNHTVPMTHRTDNCRVEDNYHFAFYDAWHPSTFLHFKLAQRIIETLQQ